MTFKLNPQLRLIKAPIILVIDGVEHRYPDGASLTPLEFDKQYMIDYISARAGSVVVALKENNQSAVVNWIGEEAVSFF